MIASIIYTIGGVSIIWVYMVFVYQWVLLSYIGSMNAAIRFWILTRSGLYNLTKVNIEVSIKTNLSVGKPM